MTPPITAAIGLDLELPEITSVGLPIAILLYVAAVVALFRRGAVRSRLPWFCTVVGACLLVTAMAGAEVVRRPALVSLLVLCTLGWAVAGYGRVTGGLRSSVRGFLIVLRLGAVGLTLVVLSRPVAHWTTQRTIRPTIAIALDNSGSMLVRDVTADGSGRPQARVDAVNNALREIHGHLSRLSDEFEFAAYPFAAASLARTDIGEHPWRIDGAGDATDVGAVLAQIHAEAGSPNMPLGGVILISDGSSNVDSQTDPPLAARLLADAKVPLFAVGVGSAEPRGETRSLVGIDLRMPTQAAVGARVGIEADFECLGFAGQLMRVECLWDGERVEVRPIRVNSARETIRATFEMEAHPAGFHAVEVRASPVDASWRGDPTALSQFIRVIDDLIQILYIEAKPRVEAGFIARALAGEERFRLIRANVARPLEGAWSSALPRREEDWKAYHAVLIGDVQRRDLTGLQQEALKAAVVEHGTGLALIGGFDNSGSRGLLDTPLGDALPIERGDDEPLAGPLRVRPTPSAVGHPLGSLGGLGADAWAKLPELPGGNRFGRAKPAAQVILTDEADRPLLVTATIGRGRTVAFAIDSTWRWSMQSEDGAAFQRRFWRQLVYWLANRRPRVQITVDRPRYDLADVRAGARGVAVEAFVVDGISGLPIDDARLEVSHRRPDGSETPLALYRTDDRWTNTLYLDAAGGHTLRLVARHGTEEIGQSEARFVIEQVDRERRNPLANMALMQTLATVTSDVGGRMVALDELDALLDSLAGGGVRRTRTEMVRRDIVDELRWPVLLAICGLLTLEWAIRKRMGLV